MNRTRHRYNPHKVLQLWDFGFSSQQIAESKLSGIPKSAEDVRKIVQRARKKGDSRAHNRPRGYRSTMRSLKLTDPQEYQELRQLRYKRACQQFKNREISEDVFGAVLFGLGMSHDQIQTEINLNWPNGDANASNTKS